MGKPKPAKILYLPLLPKTENILSFINVKDTGKMTVSVMGERDSVRKTYLLNRGAYDQPAEEVNQWSL